MFDYIYSDHKSKYTFIKCPTALFTDERFKSLTNDMKLLYMLMLDRTSLSVKNHWYDSAHKVYIHFPVAEIMEKLGVANQKAARLLRGLEEMGLIEREKVGLGKPDRIYVKDCCKAVTVDEDTATEQVQNEVDTVVENVEKPSVPLIENHPSEDGNAHPEDVIFPMQSDADSHAPLYNNQTKRTRLTQSDLSSQPAGQTDGMEQRRAYELLIKQNIEYDWFLSAYTLPESDPQRPKGTKDELDEMVAIMVECICTRSGTIRVGGQKMPAEVVRSQFLKLNNEHIQYVFRRLYGYAGEIANIKAYMITVLYNAALTMNTAFGLDFRAAFGA